MRGQSCVKEAAAAEAAAEAAAAAAAAEAEEAAAAHGSRAIPRGMAGGVQGWGLRV